MMKKLLATAALTVSAAALAAPAHADDAHWTSTAPDTGRCVGKLVVMPVAKAVTPIPLTDTPTPTCGSGSLINSAG